MSYWVCLKTFSVCEFENKHVIRFEGVANESKLVSSSKQNVYIVKALLIFQLTIFGFIVNSRPEEKTWKIRLTTVSDKTYVVSCEGLSIYQVAYYTQYNVITNITVKYFYY